MRWKWKGWIQNIWKDIGTVLHWPVKFRPNNEKNTQFFLHSLFDILSDITKGWWSKWLNWIYRYIWLWLTHYIIKIYNAFGIYLFSDSNLCIKSSTFLHFSTGRRGSKKKTPKQIIWRGKNFLYSRTILIAHQIRFWECVLGIQE